MDIELKTMTPKKQAEINYAKWLSYLNPVQAKKAAILIEYQHISEWDSYYFKDIGKLNSDYHKEVKQELENL